MWRRAACYIGTDVSHSTSVFRSEGKNSVVYEQLRVAQVARLEGTIASLDKKHLCVSSLLSL
jgi:hypothetical protein